MVRICACSARRSPPCARCFRECRAAPARTANGSAAAPPGTRRTARRANSRRPYSRRDRSGTAEERPDVDALQAIQAAGQPARAVGRFLQQQAEAERDHDQRQMAESRDDEARRIAEQAGGHAATAVRRAARPSPYLDNSPRYRRRCRKRRRGRARRCRQKPRIRSSDSANSAVMAIWLASTRYREQHERQQRRQPEDDLAPVPADLRAQKVVRAGDAFRWSRAQRLPNRPAGRHIRSAPSPDKSGRRRSPARNICRRCR